MKSLCIIDTCSLIFMNDVQVARRPLHSWLLDEFEVHYSQTVLEEIRRHSDKIRSRRRWESYVYSYPRAAACEKMLFGQPLQREIVSGTCRYCKQPIFVEQRFEIDLASSEDQGERHNCCVALAAVRAAEGRQVIFITDDRRAIRDYVAPMMRVFPLGVTWTSLDFVTFLFFRHRSRITLDDVKVALRDVNANAPTSETPQDRDRRIVRLTDYNRRVEQIDRVLAGI